MFSRYFAALVALVPVVFAQTEDPALVAALRTAATNEERVALLRDDQFVFNFLAGVGTVSGAAGTNTGANAGNYPALIGNGIAMTIGFLEGCGMNTPHVHPRATEINFAVNGTLRTGMLNENGARFVFNNVPAGSASVFPRGAIHFEMNLECEPTLFVAAFNDEDPGVTAVAQRFFGLPPDVISAALGDIGVTEVAGLEAKIPNNIAQGTEDCLKRCGIKKVMQPTSQRQPRLPSNALPPGFSGPPPAAPPASAPASPSSYSYTPAVSSSLPSLSSSTPASLPSSSPSHAAGSFKDNLGVNSAVTTGNGDNANNSSMDGNSELRPFLIALVVINALFVIGALAALFLFVMRKREGRGRRVDHTMIPQFPTSEKDTEYYDPHYPISHTPPPRGE